jgi:hypothetical protein
MSDEIKLRKGTAASWANVNPVLATGEPGFESDTKKLKFGDGSAAWNDLAYFALDGGDLDVRILSINSQFDFGGTTINMNDHFEEGTQPIALTGETGEELIVPE